MSGAEFDAEIALLTFATHYEAEMARLPQDASDDARDARHRELLGIPEPGEDSDWVPGEYVDIAHVIGIQA